MTKLSKRPARKNPIARFLRKEDGALTFLNLYLTIMFITLGGLAVDVAYLIAARTQLQVAADITAHAALFNRDWTDKDNAKTRALQLASSAMPKYLYGDVIEPDDIEFGVYDAATNTFTPDENSRAAVRVNAFRISERSNTAASYLLQFIGRPEWDIVTAAVFETYRPPCMREGFVADSIVDIQSNNSYSNGFCIHSNQYVSVNQNNYYEPGTVVSMPDISNIDLPRSGFEKNEGLEQALRPGKYQLHIVNRIDEIIDGMTDTENRYFRPYITNPDPLYVTRANKMTPADFTQGRVNVIQCSNKGVTLESDEYEDMVIIGRNCDFSLQNGVKLYNMTLISTSTSDRSIDSPQGLVLGRDDNCADGGGTVVVTYGGFNVAANLEMYGSQVIAKGPIDFTANADGIQGASMISAETIDGTSNMDFGFCGTGMDDVFQAEYFRMRG